MGSLILCTRNVPLFTGMLERAWKKASSLRPERTWQHWKRITKKLEWTQLKERKMKEKSTKEDTHKKRNMHNRFIYNKIYFLKTLINVKVEFSSYILPLCNQDFSQ